MVVTEHVSVVVGYAQIVLKTGINKLIVRGVGEQIQPPQPIQHDLDRYVALNEDFVRVSGCL